MLIYILILNHTCIPGINLKTIKHCTNIHYNFQIVERLKSQEEKLSFGIDQGTTEGF